MVVGETIELFVVFAMVIISIIIVILIQKATGGVDNEDE
jgi:preprotein translocase subunit SecG